MYWMADKQKKYIAHLLEDAQGQGSAPSLSDECPLPGSQTPSPCVLPWWTQEGISLRSLIPFNEDSTLMT